MNDEDFLSTAKNFLSGKLFEISGTPIDGPTLLTAFGILIVTHYFSQWLGRALVRSEILKKVQGPSARVLTERVAKTVVWGLGGAIAVGTLGLDLGALLAAGAVFAVGIGLAFQNIAQNIVAGVLLVFEETVKPGDILRVNGQLVRVKECRLRATVATTLDEEALIIPNSHLAQSVVTNYTYGDNFLRLRATVGVAYGSDMEEVDDVLYRAARSFPSRTKDREPRVLLQSFGDSAVNFDVSVWTTDPWSMPMTLSSLHHTLWTALADAGITIAFPQVDVHVNAGAFAPPPPPSVVTSGEVVGKPSEKSGTLAG